MHSCDPQSKRVQEIFQIKDVVVVRLRNPLTESLEGAYRDLCMYPELDAREECQQDTPQESKQ